jgi:hypothetical protein
MDVLSHSTKEPVMYRTKWLIAAAMLIFAANAYGQTIVVESPVIPVQSEVVYYPPATAPVVVNSPVVTGQTVWYSPAPASVAPALTVTGSAAPVVVAYPPSAYAAPVTVYRPTVVTPYSTYYLGRGSVGQPKIYVPGQPVRNAFRWAAP